MTLNFGSGQRIIAAHFSLRHLPMPGMMLYALLAIVVLVGVLLLAVP